MMHATALSFPGAAYHRPADLHPPRLDIALPRALGSRLAADAAASVRAEGNHSYFYSCINCERGEATLTLTLTLALTLTLTLTVTLSLTVTLTLTLNLPLTLALTRERRGHRLSRPHAPVQLAPARAGTQEPRAVPLLRPRADGRYLQHARRRGEELRVPLVVRRGGAVRDWPVSTHTQSECRLGRAALEVSSMPPFLLFILSYQGTLTLARYIP